MLPFAVSSGIGASAVAAAFLRGDELYIGSCGDCRAVLGRQRGDGFEAIDLTVDHKPDRSVQFLTTAAVQLTACLTACLAVTL
eukprot:SAG31_NODE_76_length_27534_cov_13.661868_15_plen_83_part_00